MFIYVHHAQLKWVKIDPISGLWDSDEGCKYSMLIELGRREHKNKGAEIDHLNLHAGSAVQCD